MAWDDDLVGVHRDIAACNHKRVSVLAGPGTGKTTYAMLRSVQRVLEEGADPERVLVISYTRTAANDLRNKLQADRDESVNQVRATTLHAFAFGLLQSESAFSAIGRTRRVLLDHEQETLIHDLGGEFGGYRERKRLLNELLSGWDDGSRLHPCHTDVPTERDFERAVLQWLREHKAMLVGEVVSMAYSHFESSPWSDIFTQFDHIYVDEYQDLNGVEQKFVNLIADRCEATLMIVGDDDQSIYGFRNANPEGILRFHSNDEVTPFELSVCGRCPKNFVELADYLINHAPNRSKGPLRAKDPSEGILKRYQWPSLEQEIEGIASEVAEEVSNGEVAPGQVLVLCNRRMVGKAIRDALVRRGVLAESFYGQEPLEKRATQERFSWLQLLADPNDVVALRIAVSSIQGDRRKNMWQSLRSIAPSESDGILGALERLVQGDLQTNTSTRHLVNLVVELRERIDQLASLELPELVLELFPEENEDFDEMRDIALQAVEVSESASELVNTIVETMVQRDVPEDPDFVRVMSLHKSKGLTASDVYITTTIEQVLPFYSASFSEEEMEFSRSEGRRLFYVALTRAQRKLIISYPYSVPSRLANRWGVSQEVERRNGRIMLPAASYIRSEMGSFAPPLIARRYPETS